ncbi:TolC family protein [Dyadobacter bucti]|uniref:TolC family protein n=1 Tax=Dyadobacter bucti TaxID=2572203 RepID=UPI0011098028|nr:TolC family protein [Dyadobacter bucti]
MKTRIALLILTTLLCVTNIGHGQDSLHITVKKLFELAENNSRQLKLDAIRIQDLQAGVEVAKNQRLPDVDMAVSAGYLTDVGVIGMGTMKTGFYDMPHFSNSYVLQASYLLFSGGRVERDIEISELRGRVAGLNYEKNKMEVKLLLVGYYLDLFRLLGQRNVYKSNINQASMLLEKIDNRMRAGIVLRSDKIRSELLLEEMKLQLVKVSNRIRIINNAMVEILVLPEGTIIEPDTILPENNVTELTLNTLQQVALQNQPELKINQLNTEMAEKRQQQIKAAYLPEASLYASNGLARPYVYDIPAKDIYANNLTVGVRLNYSLSGLYKNKARVDAATKGLQAATQYEQLAHENMRKAVFNAYTLWNEAGDQLSSEAKKLELATENYRRITNAYDQQVALITDITDASNQKLAAELQLTNAQAQRVMRYFELQKVTGQLN